MTNEQLLAFVRKNPIGVTCLVLGLLLIGFSYYRSDDEPAADMQLIDKSSEAERLAANLKNAAQLREQVDALADANKKIQGRLIHMSDLANNNGYFYKLEAESGVKLVLVQQNVPTAVAAGKGTIKQVFLRVPFTVAVQGDYASLLDFLRRLESGTHFCSVLSCALTTGRTVAGMERSNVLTLTLGIELLGLP